MNVPHQGSVDCGVWLLFALFSTGVVDFLKFIWLFARGLLLFDLLPRE